MGQQGTAPRRFDHNCRGCSIQTEGDRQACYECVLRDIVSMDDVACCEHCRAPLALGLCSSCDGRFDGENLVLRRLETAGLGNTAGHWTNRPWKELGAAVCGYKDSGLRFLFFPLNTLFVGKLYDYLQASDVEYDVIVGMPSSKDLVPRLLDSTNRNRDAMGITGQIRTDVIAKNGDEPQGGLHVSPQARWEMYKAENLYYVANPEPIIGARVLLVDDVYKSGCSMNLAAMRLLEAGSASVDGFALCRWV